MGLLALAGAVSGAGQAVEKGLNNVQQGMMYEGLRRGDDERQLERDRINYVRSHGDTLADRDDERAYQMKKLQEVHDLETQWKADEDARQFNLAKDPGRIEQLAQAERKKFEAGKETREAQAKEEGALAEYKQNSKDKAEVSLRNAQAKTFEQETKEKQTKANLFAALRTEIGKGSQADPAKLRVLMEQLEPLGEKKATAYQQALLDTNKALIQGEEKQIASGLLTPEELAASIDRIKTLKQEILDSFGMFAPGKGKKGSDLSSLDSLKKEKDWSSPGDQSSPGGLLGQAQPPAPGRPKPSNVVRERNARIAELETALKEAQAKKNLAASKMIQAELNKLRTP